MKYNFLAHCLAVKVLDDVLGVCHNFVSVEFRTRQEFILPQVSGRQSVFADKTLPSRNLTKSTINYTGRESSLFLNRLKPFTACIFLLTQDVVAEPRSVAPPISKFTFIFSVKFSFLDVTFLLNA